jgi:hypothetical protein
MPSIIADGRSVGYNSLMLWLFQAAEPFMTNGASRVYVTLKQPSGLPEWVKLLISAGLGAVFGIVSSTAMEFLKPEIGGWIDRRSARKQLLAEIKQNIEAIDGFHQFLATEIGDAHGERLKAAFYVVRHIMGSVQTNRFDFFLSERKDVLYRLKFYSDLDEMYDQAKLIRTCSLDDFDVLTVAYQLKRIDTIGRKILQDNGGAIESSKQSPEVLYNVYLKMAKRIEAENG